MTEESTAPPSEVITSPTSPRITAVTKTKNPNRVAQGKKLAAIRAEKRRVRNLEPEEDSGDNGDSDGYQKMTFYFTLVSSVAALISIPFVYRYLTASDPPTTASDPPTTAVMTNRTTQAVQPTTTTPDKQPKKGPSPDMIVF